MRSQKEILEEVKWRTLIILDACRYDTFLRCYARFPVLSKLKVEPARVTSYETTGWISHLFSDDLYPDLIYLSANPIIRESTELPGGFKPGERFGLQIALWDKGFDPHYGTVRPDYVFREALKHLRSGYRLVIHFIQPHGPYLGIFQQLQHSSQDVYRVGHLPDVEYDELIKQGKLTWEALKAAYERNLLWTLPFADLLLELSDKPAVLTSDHGEHLGESGLVSHLDASDATLTVPIAIAR